jgi:hypothetical protein
MEEVVDWVIASSKFFEIDNDSGMFRRMSFSEILMNMRNFIEIKRKEITF